MVLLLDEILWDFYLNVEYVFESMCVVVFVIDEFDCFVMSGDYVGAFDFVVVAFAYDDGVVVFVDDDLFWCCSL